MATATTVDTQHEFSSPKHQAGDEKDPKRFGVRAKTTWHLKPVKERNLWEFIVGLDILPESAYEKKGKEWAETVGKPPYRPIWKENLFILSWASMPLAAHAAWNYFVPDHKMHWAAGWMLYHTHFIFYAANLLKHLHYYMTLWGCFDQENRGRDIADDKHASKLGQSVFIYLVARTMAPFLLAWRGEMTNPFEGLSWATPFKLMWWEIALDYWFYLYHRSCHEFDFIWFVHRQHHATKHPTPILSILADDIQEVLEVFIVPFLATAISPKMSFAELYLVVAYTFYVEALGHSGVRAEWPHPILGWILRPLGMDLAVEDHDLHHRLGKSGMNYGKQTRVWDRIFGTISERVDTTTTGYGFDAKARAEAEAARAK